MPSSRHGSAVVVLLAALFFFVPRAARAHAIDNATLVIAEKAKGTFHVQFQSGSPSLGAIENPAVYPPTCQLEKSTLTCGPTGLSGKLQFPWLLGTFTRVTVDVTWLDGSHLLRVVAPDVAELSVYDHGVTGWAAFRPVLVDYGLLGVEHILLGFDHLCLVLALAMLVKGARRLVATITAFTVAHSITLAFTALGYVEVPIAPVEALIALSIALACAECLRPGDSLTRRAPWIVAFIFGLLHGFGFASALLEVGLPEAHLPSALLGFNLGVELGQLLVVLSFVGLGALLKRLGLLRVWMRTSVVYAVGGLAAYWSVDRTLAVFGIMG